MRVTAHDPEGEARAERLRERTQESGLAAPDLGRYSAPTLDAVQVVVGTNPQEVLDLYLDAQQRAGKIRTRLKEVDSLLASYKARFWSGGQNPSFFDLDRKALLSKIKNRIRASATRKMNNDEVDEEAHADREYLQFVELEQKKRLRMEELQAEHSGLQKDLETALGVVAYYDRAHRSTESMIWFAREENKKTF